MKLSYKHDMCATFYCGLVPLPCIYQNISRADLFFHSCGSVCDCFILNPTKSSMKQIRSPNKEPEPQMASADNLKKRGENRAKFMRTKINKLINKNKTLRIKNLHMHGMNCQHTTRTPSCIFASFTQTGCGKRCIPCI